jgi:1,4-alpha-glucan branching enzyme
MGSIPYADALGTGVTFRVWSPNATNVTVPGTFNNWTGSTNQLFQEGISGIWSRDFPSARNGDQYKYLINGTVWKRDPRGRKEEHTVGNSIVYDPNAFNWAGDTRLHVTNSNLVIYELHVGAFYDSTPSSGGPGKFADAITKLNYLTNLGINAVELMPVMEFPGDYSWGYNLVDPYAVENVGYGGPDGLKSFVKAAHQRGIRVLLDVVHNHYGSTTVPGEMDLYGFDTNGAPGIYFYSSNDICCTSWGRRPDYSAQGVRDYITDNFRMWLDEYHVDGFRWDAVGAMRHYAPNYDSIPEAESLIQSINSTVIHTDHPGTISIAEDDSFGLNFDGEWTMDFGNTLISEVVKTNDASRDMVALNNAMDGSGFFRVLFSESHDWVGALNGTNTQRLPKRISATDPQGYAARKRSMLAAAAVLSAPGTPMLFMGQEMLQTNQFSDSTPMNWANTNTQSRIVNFYRDMIRLRRNLDGVSAGMTGPNMTWHVVDDSAKVLAFHRWGAAANDQVMVVMNFSGVLINNYQINGFPANGNWYVNLNSDSTNYSADFGNRGSSLVAVSSGSGQVNVAPYSVLVLSRQALPQLDADGDGLFNGWEQQHFGDPVSASATDDPDHDGANNLQEQAADTDPNSAASVLKFTEIRVHGALTTLAWKGGQSARQVIQSATQMAGSWTSIFTNPPPTAITNSIAIPTPTAAGSYFRIQTSS